jgi:tRNA nucleotidyltransferase/poly(A) polymerase
LQTGYRLVSEEISLKDGTAFLNHLQTLLNGFSIPVFPLKGRDLLALHIKPGENLGGLLKAVETWWIAEDFTPDKKACVEYLKSLL